jgi:hypothetical protein
MDRAEERAMAFVLWMALAAFAEEPKCSPACDVGEVCTPAGRCVTPCTPPCEAGSRCNANGECVAGESAGPPPVRTTTTSAANVGAAQVCVARQANESAPRVRWSVLIDGRIAGSLNSGAQQCFDTDPGTRTVKVMYVEPSTGARPEASKTVQVAPNATVHVSVASSGTNVVFQ